LGASYYFSSDTLTVDVYQNLVDRGWRRSGTIFYKPDVLRHCCPHYTIRLPVASFKPTKDQRKTVNKWNDYVLGDAYKKEAAKRYPISKEEKARLRNTFDFVQEIHRSDHNTIKRPPNPTHKFEVTLEPPTFTQEKYSLYQQYQKTVHKETTTPSSFKSFLCTSPLQNTSRDLNGKPPKPLGTYHQTYRLNTRLIALSVLDLLPHAVSAVYFIYDPALEQWGLGKLSAMREAALALQGGYEYYYMGFYIYSCAKMRYKGDFRPQYVLDPVSLEWGPLDEVKGVMDVKGFVSLDREARRRVEGRDGVDEDSYDDYPFPTAAEGVNAHDGGMSLFDLKVPGLMSVEEMEDQVDLGSLAISVGGRMAEAQDLVAWEGGSVRDVGSPKGIVAELVAGLGAEAAWQVVVELG
ncbi:arginine-tRNA-protein transferase 1, partial [Phaeosphaeriaceae sp. PMI808]